MMPGDSFGAGYHNRSHEREATKFVSAVGVCSFFPGQGSRSRRIVFIQEHFRDDVVQTGSTMGLDGVTHSPVQERPNLLE